MGVGQWMSGRGRGVVTRLVKVRRYIVERFGTQLWNLLGREHRENYRRWYLKRNGECSWRKFSLTPRKYIML